jgi:two-component system, NarL family, invasion response regulator UvrY
MKSFLIVDDHEIVRKGLKLLINDFYMNARITEASDGSEAVKNLKSDTFDVVVLDIQMPKTNSFELLDYIVKSYPRTKVLIFSMGSETLYGKRVIRAGAKGFLSKESSMSEVQNAIETVLNGKKYLSAKLLESLIDEVSTDNDPNPFSKLSTREFEIATFLLAGLSVSEIGDRTRLQTSTVGTYKARIFEKLNISNLLELKELSVIYNFT